MRVQAVAGTLPPERVKWTANISKDTEDMTERSKIILSSCGNARDGATGRMRGKQERTKHPWLVLPDKIMERIMIIVYR